MSATVDDRGRMQANQAGWNRRAVAHLGSSYYDLDAFRAGEESLRPLEVSLLGDVAGKDFLNLQCHIGVNAISWARRGANVTAVDFAEEALEIGRDLAAGLKTDITFLQSNIYDLPKVLEGSFDIVYTDQGTICYLPDLDGWAQVIAHFLKPGGVFHIVEIHPVLAAFDEVDGELRVRDYPIGTGPHENVISDTYGDEYGDAREIEPYTSYTWLWTIPEVMAALIGAGLRIEKFVEEPVDCRQRFKAMVRDERGRGLWRLPGDPIPMSWGVSARKPE